MKAKISFSLYSGLFEICLFMFLFEFKALLIYLKLSAAIFVQGSNVLAAIDDIQIMLDDHIIKSQIVKNSPFIGPYLHESTVRIVI